MMRKNLMTGLLCAAALSAAASDRRIFLSVGNDAVCDSFAAAYAQDNPGEDVSVLPYDGSATDAARLREIERDGQVVGVLWWQGTNGTERLWNTVKEFRATLGHMVTVVGSGDETARRILERLPRCAFAQAERIPEDRGLRLYEAWTSVANRLVGKYVSRDYGVSVGGRPVEVVATPFREQWKKPGQGVWVRKDGRYSYATFVLRDEATVEVRSAALDLSKAVIRPESKAVRPLTAEKGRLSFRMRPGDQLVVEPAGRERALVLAANPVRTDDPAPGTEKVRHFGPGYHRAGFIELGDGEGLHLAEGAWVEGLVHARGKNISITGPGVLSGAPASWRIGPPVFRAERGVTRTGAVVTMCGENLRIRDTTIYSGWVYNLAFNDATNVVVDNVKVISGRNINDDGIDPCRTKDIVIRNSFVHTQDDCIAPKYWIDNMLVENCVLWTDCANAIRLGFECEKGMPFRNVVMKDIDIVHLSLVNRGVSNYWARAALAVEAAGGQRFENMLFERIRLDECPEGWVFTDVRTRKITDGGLPFCHTDEAGFVDGLVYRDIHLKKRGKGMISGFAAHDEAHPITGVRFESVTNGDNPMTAAEFGLK